jgi:7-keto-8-aminopelargonate synthetase-like enzyme
MLDEAHAVGVLGDHGRGLADRIGVANRVEIQMGTLSKAFGVSGGYVCGSRKLIDLLINRARSFIYSTAPPPALAEASRAAVEFLMSDEGEARREKLWENLKHLDKELDDSFPRERPPHSAIIPIIVGNEDTAVAASRWLSDRGFFVPAIRYPTVAKGTARLRITLSASHTCEEISRLCEALKKLTSRLKET